ncbi:glycosyltransferase family 2 protein [Kitasatospora sp. NPDC050543]|uniref:glycosyltransferase family 2 protein n=1 Tax=Kitasatospora sp. NPDC050543 TaxID=3364054 RepID=UPI0037A8F0D3
MTTRQHPEHTDRTDPTLTVVICAYTLDRWDDLCAAVESVRTQQRQPAEILLVIDHCPELARLAARLLPAARVMENCLRQGLSGARNTGVAAASGEVVAFLDDDAAAAPDWTAHLLAGYRDPAVLGVGGLVRARWESGRPRWFPPEFDWVVGCTYRGAPASACAVRNFIGANMSFRRAAILDAGGFSTRLGRIGSKPLGCEETELCLRIAQRNPDAVLYYEPAAAVRHHVPASRTTWAYFRARCYAEGRSKAVVAQLAGPGAALATERGYLRRAVPAALAQSLREARPRTAGALVSGVGITTLGYLTGRLALVRPAARRAAPAPEFPVRSTRTSRRLTRNRS